MRGIDYSSLVKFQLSKKISNCKVSLGSSDKFFFISIEKESGLYLKKIIKTIDKDKLKNVKYVDIDNTFIDNLCISTLKSIFPNLKELKITNSVILKDCDLGIINIEKIIINDSIIENIKSFNLCSSNIHLLNCNINNVTNAYINSKEIYFDECKIDYYKLFLMCNLFDLETLFIRTRTTYDGYSNETEDLSNSFNYLPYSCPNIKRLRIEAKVDDLDFLTILNKLENVSILSTHEELLGETLIINNKKKLEDYYQKNYNKVEIDKLLHGINTEKDEISYITRNEMDRIIKLNRFFRKINYTEQEKNVLMQNYHENYINFILEQQTYEIDGFYKNSYDELIYEKNEEIMLIQTTIPYKLIYNYGCVYYDREKEVIVKPEKILFYIDGLPILLRKVSKPILTVDGALDYVKARKNKENFYDPTYDYIEKIKENANELKGPISVQQFVSCENLNFHLNIIYKDVLDRLEGDKSIIYKLLKYDNMWDYIFHLKLVEEKCLNLFSKMISLNINKFTKEEIIYIMKNFPYKDSLEKRLWNWCWNDFVVSDELVNNIDEKCDFKYIDLLESINHLNQIYKTLIYQDNSGVLNCDDLEKIKGFNVKTRRKCYNETEV